MPLRTAISSLDRAALRAEARAEFGLDADRPTLLVFGGSQGAAVAEPGGRRRRRRADRGRRAGAARPRPEEHRRDGPGRARRVVRPYVVVDYLERMDLAYAAADLALCRAGAVTVAELSAVGLPAAFVPLPIGNGEQRRNALPVVEAGGGLLVEDADLDARPGSRRTLVPLLTDPAALAGYARHAAAAGAPDADERLADIVLTVAADRAMSAADVAAWTDPVPSPGGAGRRALRRHRRRRDERHRPDPAGPRRAASPAATGATPRRCWRCARWAPGWSVGHDPAHLGGRRHRRGLHRHPRRTTPSSSPPASAGLRVLPRAVALAAVMAGRRSVAVAGTHGKTSTTSMLTVAVQACGVDPSFAIGGDLNESGSNAHAGEGDIFVAEADESDRSFLLLAPVRRRSSPTSRPTTWTTTATSPRSRPPSTASWRPCTPDGFVVVCADDPGAARLRGVPTPARLRTYGRAADADLRLDDLEVAPDGTSYTAVLDGARARPGRGSSVPGEHMALNSAAALLAGLELGLPGRRADRGPGPLRRRAPPVRAQGRRSAASASTTTTPTTRPRSPRSCAAARAVAGDGRLVVAFQPHLYSRTREFAAGFGAGARPGRRGRGHGRLRRPRGPGARA